MTYRINCEMCLVFVKAYFQDSLSNSVKDAVLCHLFKCKSCLDKYKSYANTIDIGFDIRQEALDFICETRKSDKKAGIEKIMEENGFKKDLDTVSHRWTRVAERFTLDSLLQLPAFKSFVNEDFTPREDSYDEDIDVINAYTKYWAIQLCKKIDFLEDCLNVKEEDSNA